MFKKLMNITCEKATFLSSKKEEQKTSSLENLKLKMHYSICDGCKRFEEQSALITNHVKYLSDYTQQNMSTSSIEKLRKMTVSK